MPNENDFGATGEVGVRGLRVTGAAGRPADAGVTSMIGFAGGAATVVAGAAVLELAGGVAVASSTGFGPSGDFLIS